MKLLPFILSILILAPAVAVASTQNNTAEWKTAYTVGKFLNSEPPKPDQIFKIQYRVLNGIIDRFNAGGSEIIAHVNSNNTGTLEIRHPRNYPYTNAAENIPGNLIIHVNGENISSYDYDTTDCFFVFSIPFKGSAEVQAAWAYQAVNTPYYGDDIPDSCITQTVVQDVPVRSDGTIPPLHQFKAGVLAEDVICREGFELVISPDDKPYCVKPKTLQILKDRWNI